MTAACGVPLGKDCLSPNHHSAFSTPQEMMRFIARLRQLAGGKPVGLKLCIGYPWERFAIVMVMLTPASLRIASWLMARKRSTGAALVEFSDPVGTPLQDGLQLGHNTLVGSPCAVHHRHRGAASADQAAATKRQDGAAGSRHKALKNSWPARTAVAQVC